VGWLPELLEIRPFLEPGVLRYAGVPDRSSWLGNLLTLAAVAGLRNLPNLDVIIRESRGDYIQAFLDRGVIRPEGDRYTLA
jgi:hypothetical protein